MKKLSLLIFLWTTVVYGNAQPEKITFDWFTQSDEIPVFVEPTPPPSEYIVRFNFYQLSSMWQEILLLPGGIPSTPVTANTQTIGTVQGQSMSGMILSNGASTARPVLASDGVVFDNTNDQLSIVGGPSNFLKDLHAVNPLWGNRFKIKFNGSDGVAKPIWQTHPGGSTTFGIFVQRTSANRLQIIGGKGTSGTPMINFTTTRTITAADGVCIVHVNVNGTGANACSVRIKNAAGTITTETFTSLAGVDNNATSALFIGGSLNATLSHSFDIINRNWTTQEMLDYEASTPANTTDYFTPLKLHEYDFGDVTKVFSDASGTTPITNGTAVLRVDNKVTVTYPYAPIRRWTGVDASTGLIWGSSVQNGRGGVTADGSGTRVLTASEDIIKEAATSWTLFFVAKNSDVTFGSQWWNGGNNYAPMTGSNYSANGTNTGDPAQPYFLIHPTSGVTGYVPISRSNGCNIIAVRRFGQTFDIWSQAGAKNTTGSLTGAMAWSFLGTSSPNGVPNWHPDGYYCYLLMYRGFIEDDQVEAKLHELETYYSIPHNTN